MCVCSTGLKLYEWPMKIGLFFCIAGELLRKGAMLTAWSNFTHLVRERRVEGHKLVTHGVYSLCRHPSYAGWFWWSIGTQVRFSYTFFYTMRSSSYVSQKTIYQPCYTMTQLYACVCVFGSGNLYEG